MTLNGIMAIIMHYLAEFGRFGGELHEIGEVRSILSATEEYSCDSWLHSQRVLRMNALKKGIRSLIQKQQFDL